MPDTSISSIIKALEREVDQLTTSIDSLGKSLSSVVDKMGGVSKAAGGAVSGGQMMSGSFGSMPPPPAFGTGMSAGGMAIGAGLGALGLGALMVGTGVKTAYNMMPNTQAVIGRETSFYNAAVMQGTTSRQAMRNATFGAMFGGMTQPGGDAMVGEYLSSRGMAFSKSANSTYMQTVRSVSNAAKYMNMSNERAMVAIEDLTSGKQSKNLMQNLGIYTSDLTTGRAKTQGQIFSEIADRLTAGRQNVSEEQINESFRRGNLGASLEGLGLSADQQQMMKQFLIERSKGNYMDLSNDQQMAELQKKSGINPAQAGYMSNTFDTRAMNDAAEAYIKGMQAAVPMMDSLSKASGELAKNFGFLKSFLDTLSGNNAGGALIQGVSEAIGQITTAIATGIGMLTTALLGVLGGGGLIKGIQGLLGLKGKTPNAGPAGKIGPVGSEVLQTASKAGVGSLLGGAAFFATAAAGAIAGPFARGAAGEQSATRAGQTASQKASTKAQTTTYTPTPGKGAIVPGATYNDLFGPNKKNLLQPISDWWNSLFGNGGTSSTVGTGNATGSAKSGKISFIYPINGAKITDGYGPRKAPVPGAKPFHSGIDFAAAQGTPIMASAQGTVTMAGDNGGLGLCVKIQHPNGMRTLYGHQSRIQARVGQEVGQGQIIGYVGSTGMSTGPHLHFEVHDSSGNPINPMSVLSGTAAGFVGDTANGTHRTAGSASAAPDITGIIDQRAKQKGESIPGLRMGSNSSSSMGIAGAQSGMAGRLTGEGSRSIQTGMSDKPNILTNNRMGQYLNGAPRAKGGDSYVANDGPVNVHSGEAILTAEQADVWRSALKQGGLGKRGGSNVTINLTIAQASESEARRFAGIVKDLLESDQMISKMGRM